VFIIQNKIKKIIKQALVKHIKLLAALDINYKKIEIPLEPSQKPSFGDYTTNIALILGFNTQEKVMQYAGVLANEIKKNKIFEKVDISLPGFINLTVKTSFLSKNIYDIIYAKEKYTIFKKTKKFYNIETISLDPTRQLSISDIRTAAYTFSLANIWEYCGIKVNTECYVNDYDDAVNLLSLKVFLEYKHICDEKFKVPEGLECSEDLKKCAYIIYSKKAKVFSDKEYNKNKILDVQTNSYFRDFSVTYVVSIVKTALKAYDFNVDVWTYESTIHKLNLISKTLDLLKPYMYKNEGATWLKTSAFNDDKDRVIIRSEGDYTFFAPSIAYTYAKLSRGYNKIFVIISPRHHGFINRLKISIEMLGYKQEQLEMLIQQKIIFDKKSKDTDLNGYDLEKKFGKNYLRWFLVSQTLKSNMLVCLNEKVIKTDQNSVYYVQYAHARINNILLKVDQKEMNLPRKFDLINLPIERSILCKLNNFTLVLEGIVTSYEVHRLTSYLTQLSKLFHAYYEKNKIIDPTKRELTAQRYWFCYAIKTIISIGLKLLGIKAQAEM